jgi:DNA-binding GntR family transcriptional regulator
MAPAPNRIAALFDLSAGTEMIRRQRVTHDATHTPLSWSESWFPAALAAACPVLLQRERIVEGTLRRIAAVGPEWVASRGVDEVTVAAADAGMAYTLHVPVGSPVLVTCTQWVTAAGRVVEVGGSTAVQGVCAAYPYEL